MIIMINNVGFLRDEIVKIILTFLFFFFSYCYNIFTRPMKLNANEFEKHFFVVHINNDKSPISG